MAKRKYSMKRMSKEEMRTFAKKRTEERKRRRAIKTKRRADRQNTIKKMFDGDSKTVQEMLRIRY